MLRVSQQAHDLHMGRESVKELKDTGGGGGEGKSGIMASDVLVMCLHRV